MSDPAAPLPDGPLRMYLAEHEAPCPRCGYSLRGCTAEVCPECGTRLALTLAAARADRRTLLLLLLMLVWALLASATETYIAQGKARGEAQQQGPWQFGRIVSSSGGTVSRSGNVQFTLSSPATGGRATFQGVAARQVIVTSPAGGAPTWSAVPWQTWGRLGAWSLLLVLAALGLIGVARFRVRPAWPRGFVRYAVGVFVVCAALSVVLRLPIVP